ncbi:MAG: acyl-CoA synthetase [Steroidobacteraceae bacterium]
MSGPHTQLPSAAAARATEWRQRPERGSRTLLGLMAAMSLRLGRPFGRVMLHAVGAYYFLFSPRAARHMRAYLRRALGRAPRARDRMRLIMSFASTIHDRLYWLSGRDALFDVTVEGEDMIRAAVAGGGTFLMGAHVGSFEVLRAVGRRKSGFEVAMAMYEDNARKVNAIMAAAASADPPEIIAVGRLDSMLQIRERLERGMLVGVLADRLFGQEPSVPVSFFGAPARLPSSPMRVAAMLKCRVVFMLGLYRGGNRYHVVFEPLADFSATPAGERAAAVDAAVVHYAALLERHCRRDPYNWFNFFDFWGSGTPTAGATAVQRTPPQ